MCTHALSDMLKNAQSCGQNAFESCTQMCVAGVGRCKAVALLLTGQPTSSWLRSNGVCS